MEHAFSILLLCFSGALFIYAGLTALSKEIILLRRYTVSAKITDRKRYAVQLAKIICIVACSPLIAGGVGLLAGSAVAAIVFGVTMVAAIVIGVKCIDMKQ